MAGLAWQAATVREPARLPQRLPATNVDLGFHRWADAEPVIGLECTFDGRLNEQVLARAGHLLLDAEPMLDFRLAVDSADPHWKRLRPSQRSVVTVARNRQDYETFRSSGLDATRGAQIAVCLWHREAGDRLLVKMTHEVGDGFGLRLAVARLSSLYSAVELDPGHRPSQGVLPTRDAALILGSIPRLVRLRAVLALAWFLAPRLFPRRRHHPPLPDESVGPWVPVIRALPAPSLASLHAYGKERGATLNDVFLAAAYRALAGSAWDGKSALRILISIDLRRWCLPPECASAIANLASMDFPFLGRDVGRDFDDTLERVSAVMRRRKRSRPGLAWAVVGHFLVRNMRRDWSHLDDTRRAARRSNDPGRSFMTFSNEGLLDRSQLRFGELTPVSAYILPPHMALPRLHVCVTGYDGALTVTSGTSENGAAAVGRFLDALLRELPYESADAKDGRTLARPASDTLAESTRVAEAPVERRLH
jgi:NRPS condensation-like uncharacterized protein